MARELIYLEKRGPMFELPKEEKQVLKVTPVPIAQELDIPSFMFEPRRNTVQSPCKSHDTHKLSTSYGIIRKIQRYIRKRKVRYVIENTWEIIKFLSATIFSLFCFWVIICGTIILFG